MPALGDGDHMLAVFRYLAAIHVSISLVRRATSRSGAEVGHKILADIIPAGFGSVLQERNESLPSLRTYIYTHLWHWCSADCLKTLLLAARGSEITLRTETFFSGGCCQRLLWHIRVGTAIIRELA